jgi:preprotein translocase subunit SecB
MAENNQTGAGVVFHLEKIYTKDISYESPHAPHAFLENGAPDVSVQLSVAHGVLSDENGLHEVVLTVTVDAKHAGKTLFHVEVQQAGIFRLQNLPDGDLPKALEIACPSILLPFAREAISALVEKGGFPQFLISPVNFEALHQQKQAAGAPAASH